MEKFMKLALKLAKKGTGRVSPNPLVGAVIVKDGKIISTGYHKRYGDFHAERNAILNAKTSLEGSTLFVNLEPCCHHGKTPPCTDLIIKSKISQVFISILDPNPLVNGKGVDILRKNGIEVHVGLLEKEASYLNRVFIKFITKKTPYVALKVAMTLDGFICDNLGKSKWITKNNFNISHNLRNFFTAIMVGANTVLKDNPQLTCRNGGRNPIRIILDYEGKLAGKNFSVFDDQSRTIVFSSRCEKYNGAECYPETRPEDILERLYSLNIDSVLIEGGASVLSQFYDFSDELHLFYAPKIFGKGLSAFSGIEKYIDEEFDLKIKKIRRLKNEFYLEVIKNVYGNY
ncbi:riboflavin biosynthesis protein RibD [Thermosipho africanus TCF52B]|uniref:Riboflavin biosynthesis protein RibD n=1 Tax=Thermosipho africanus (strain TCF52B) TaxID=484019 RepID=B7IF99_THEAB|nr:bifunctional diaminohydroxyphosphoribosylaminopyrimidine deaminase/5-amino-6-(5-phosphoribosylamino)uracil reductase RibD [Thermosipho africanus]ACJ74763.1 riboflavin biosynthesis protein RibD [Thermosipho africanus TCF52B]